MIRLMTYNIRLGIQQGLEALAEVIRSHDPDVVALQEVGQNWKMGPAGDTTPALAEILGFEHHRFIPCIDESPRFYGHAFLSRHPILESEDHLLPKNVDEPRVLTRSRLDTPDGVLTLLTTHLSWIEDREAQGEVLTDLALRLHEEGEHVVVMGDLNEEHRPDWFQRLLEVYRDADASQQRLTFPSEKPRIRIDYLLTNRGKWEDVLVTKEREASDHLPLSGLLVP